MDFDEIRADIDAVRTNGMYLREAFANEDIVRAFNDEGYARWSREIGVSHLLRQWDGDEHHIQVRPVPELWDSRAYGRLLIIAYSGVVGWWSMLALKLPETSSQEPQLFVSHGSALKRLNQTFAQWLCAQYRIHRNRYRVRRWKYLMAGPKPFTPEEEAIVANRLQWSVRILADQTAAPFDRILVEVTNGSQHHLDWLTTTTVEPKEWLGDNWFDVKDIAPGQTAVRSKWSNEGKIRAEELILKLKPINGPEDRRYARELEGLVKEP
jgi:hypothetical protein